MPPRFAPTLSRVRVMFVLVRTVAWPQNSQKKRSFYAPPFLVSHCSFSNPFRLRKQAGHSLGLASIQFHHRVERVLMAFRSKIEQAPESVAIAEVGARKQLLYSVFHSHLRQLCSRHCATSNHVFNFPISGTCLYFLKLCATQLKKGTPESST